MILRESPEGGLEEFRIVITGEGELSFLEFDGRRYGEFKIPFSRDEIEEALSEYSPKRLSTDPLSSFGSILFNEVFSGQLGRELWTRMAEVERDNRGLRLRIMSSLERVQHLPWELLYDPSRNDFLPLSGRLTLVRSRGEGFEETPLTPLPKVRVLVVEADLSGSRCYQGNLDLLRRVQAEQSGRIEFDVITGATSEMLRERLGSRKYDIFYFFGAGEVLPTVSRRGGVRQALRLMGSDGLFNRQDLGALLHGAGVRLAVLSASHTDWIARSLAKYVPAVIGFRESVLEATCASSCNALYRRLLDGLTFELAVTAARQAVDRAAPGTGEWCKLIAFLQRPEGRILGESSRDERKPWSLASVSPQMSREADKLRRQVEIYQRNLSLLVGSGPIAEVEPEAATNLRRKIEELRERIQNL